jgi:hypothetical protein
MTAMSDMGDPQRGQALMSSVWTLASSRAQAFLRGSASTWRCSPKFRVPGLDDFRSGTHATIEDYASSAGSRSNRFNGAS